MSLSGRGVAVRFFAKTFLPTLTYASYLGLATTLALAVVWAVGPDNWRNFVNLDALAILLGGSLGTLYFAYNSYYKRYTEVNFTVRKTAMKVADVISRAQSSLVIFSGEFNSSVYENDIVMTELNNRPERCKFFFFYSEKQIDPKSLRFAQFLVERGIVPVAVSLPDVGHFAVADHTHVRLEYSGYPHDGAQFASYHYWRPDFADHVIESFRDQVLDAGLPGVVPSMLPY